MKWFWIILIVLAVLFLLWWWWRSRSVTTGSTSSSGSTTNSDSSGVVTGAASAAGAAVTGTGEPGAGSYGAPQQFAATAPPSAPLTDPSTVDESFTAATPAGDAAFDAGATVDDPGEYADAGDGADAGAAASDVDTATSGDEWSEPSGASPVTAGDGSAGAVAGLDDAAVADESAGAESDWAEDSTSSTDLESTTAGIDDADSGDTGDVSFGSGSDGGGDTSLGAGSDGGAGTTDGDVTVSASSVASADTAGADVADSPQGFAAVSTVSDGAFGPGSADPAEDGSGPAGYDIKGNADSMLYHTTESPYYGRTKAEVWFDSESTADAAGFTRWDRRDRNAGGDGGGAEAAGDSSAVADGGGGAEVQGFAAVPTVVDGAFGHGSADPAEDGSGPAGYDIKGNADSMLYHTTESPYYGRTTAEVWFDSESTADAAGFTRWDRKGDGDGSSDVQGFAAVSVPDGAYGPGSADPTPDGSAPAGYDIKGNADSMLYHTTESPFYNVTKPEVWFNTEDAARAAGFRSFKD